MGGIVGVLGFDGRPATDAHLQRLCSGASCPSGITTWTSGAVGLAHLASSPTRRTDEKQPLVSGGDALAIVFDGRIDNGEELQQLLRGRFVSDAALVLAAYEAWGSHAPQRLIGDFAFVIWDGRARHLFCARDTAGIRPFYYWSDSRRFICASDVRHVLALPGLSIAPNPGMIAEHLANALTSLDETVYAGVARLPHAHSLTVTVDGAVSGKRYWTIDPEHVVRADSDAEYADRFRELFTEAVRCRMPQGQSAALYVSGGIDSSAVTVVARSVCPPGLLPEAFSLVFGDDPERDEIRYIEDVCRHTGVRSHVTRAEDPRSLDHTLPQDVLDALRDLPAIAWKREIRAQGFRVALTGLGGDHGFFGSLYHYADLLRHGRVLAVLRQWRADRRVPDWDVTARDLVRSGVWPLLPPAMRRLLRPLARTVAGTPVVPYWIPAAFARSTALVDRLRPNRDSWKSGSAAGWDVRRDFESGWMAAELESAERISASLDLDERHPFFDRRVMEFAAALPDDQRCRGDLSRAVVRRALGDRLPPSIRTRRTAGDGSPRVATAVEVMAAAGVFGRMAIAEEGWIRQDVISGMLSRMCGRYASGDIRYAEDAIPLWVIGGTERWFRARFKSGYTDLTHSESAGASLVGEHHV